MSSSPLARARTPARVAIMVAPEDVRRRPNAEALNCVDVLAELVAIGEPREKVDAARVLLGVWRDVATVETGAEAALTPEQRTARIVQLVQAMPPDLAAALEAAGWKR